MTRPAGLPFPVRVAEVVWLVAAAALVVKMVWEAKGARWGWLGIDAVTLAACSFVFLNMMRSARRSLARWKWISADGKSSIGNLMYDDAAYKRECYGGRVVQWYGR